jgi:hypothetical protein
VYCDGKSVVSIADDVDSFCLSADGSHLAYLTGKYDHGIGGNLYIYNCQTKESEFIAACAGRMFVLSPSGQSISYTKFYRPYDPDSLICLVKTEAETPTVLGLDRYCIAISDDAQTVFCVKRQYSCYELYVYQDLEEKLLCDSLDLDGREVNEYDDYFGPVFCFNNDCTQIVYSNSDSTWFFVHGEEPVMVFDSGNTVLLGKRNITNTTPSTLYSTYYHERILTDYARSVCSTSFSGTPNLCNVLFETASEVGIFDEYLIPYTFTIPPHYYATQDEWGSLIISPYSSSQLRIDPHLKQSQVIQADEYLGKTEDGHIIYVRNDSLFSLGIDGKNIKLTDLSGYAMPFCTPYLEKIFILVYEDQEAYDEDYKWSDYEYFCTLYAIDLDSPTELCIVAEKVARNTFMINGSEITFAKYISFKEEEAYWYFTVNVKEYYSSDGEAFTYIATHPKRFEIMGG